MKNNTGELYEAPRYIQEELRTINPLYFAVWDNARKFWRVVKKRYNSSKRRNWRFDSVPIMRVQDTKDLYVYRKYQALNMSVINAMKEGFYNARKAKEISAAIDRNNEALEEKANADARYIGRDTGRSIWKHFREPSIFLSGKQWKK